MAYHKAQNVIGNWNSTQLSSFLKQHQFSDFCHVIESNQIDGEEVLCLTHSQISLWKIPGASLHQKNVRKNEFIKFLEVLKQNPEQFINNSNRNPQRVNTQPNRATTNSYQKFLNSYNQPQQNHGYSPSAETSNFKSSQRSQQPYRSQQPGGSKFGTLPQRTKTGYHSPQSQRAHSTNQFNSLQRPNLNRFPNLDQRRKPQPNPPNPSSKTININLSLAHQLKEQLQKRSQPEQYSDDFESDVEFEEEQNLYDAEGDDQGYDEQYQNLTKDSYESADNFDEDHYEEEQHLYEEASPHNEEENIYENLPHAGFEENIPELPPSLSSSHVPPLPPKTYKPVKQNVIVSRFDDNNTKYNEPKSSIRPVNKVLPNRAKPNFQSVTENQGIQRPSQLDFQPPKKSALPKKVSNNGDFLSQLNDKFNSNMKNRRGSDIPLPIPRPQSFDRKEETPPIPKLPLAYLQQRKLPMPPDNGYLTPIEIEQSTALATRSLPELPNDRWYRNVGREESKQLLQGLGNGAFLFRPTSQPNCHSTLVVMYENNVYHIMIRKKSDGMLALGVEKDNERNFHTLEEIVDFHMHNYLKVIRNGETNEVLLRLLL